MTPPEEDSTPRNCMFDHSQSCKCHSSQLGLIPSREQASIWFGEVTPSLHNSRMLFILDDVKHF